MADDLGLENKERLQQVLQFVADHVISTIDTDLKFETYEQINRKSWADATTALRGIREAMELLSLVAYMDLDTDFAALPELDLHAINAYGTTLGNRAYWQRSTIEEWLKGASKAHDETGVADFRFDLDFDETVEVEEITTTKKTKKSRKTTKKDGAK